MKTLLRILLGLAVIFFIACSEDIYLHDGKDGYSTLMYFDVSANMKVYYLDRDFSFTFTSADTVVYRENNEDLKIVQNGECYDIFKVVGLTAHNNVRLLEKQIKRFKPTHVAVHQRSRWKRCPQFCYRKFSLF